MRWGSGLALACFSAAWLPAQVVPQRLPGVDARAAALLLSGQRGGTLRAAVVASPTLPAAEGKCGLAAWVEVEGEGLLGEQREGEAEVEVVVYASAAPGQVAAFDAVIFSVDLARWGERVRQHGLRVRRHLAVPCVDLRLRLLVRNRGTGEFCVEDGRAELVDEGWAVRALGSPGPWLEVQGEDGGMTELTPPLAARPVVWPGSRLTLLVLPPRAASGPWLARGCLPVAEDERCAPLVAAPAPKVWEWEVPAGAPPGPANVAVHITPVGGEKVELPVPVWVERQDGPATWIAALRERAEDGTFAGRRDPPAGGATREADYFRVLEDLAKGSEADPRAAAIAFQRGALGDGSGGALERLVGTVHGVAARLARGGGVAVVPLLWLHHELLHDFAEAKDHLHATAASRILGGLAAAASRAGSDAQQARWAAALALAGLGELHARRGGWRDARAWFRRALVLSPEYEPARLAAAAAAEWLGEYGEVVGLLKPFEDPGRRCEEGSLRLAVNLVREGRVGRARALLARCVAGAEAPWVRAIAGEELAQLELAAGRPTAAAAVLEPLTQAFPHLSTVKLLLAQAREEEGEWAAASFLLAQARLPGDGTGVSPRLEYARWPTGRLGELRRRLAEAAERARPALAQALAHLAGGEAQ